MIEATNINNCHSHTVFLGTFNLNKRKAFLQLMDLDRKSGVN